jgi:transcriptional regulator with XRE-family HTH domain
MKMGTRIRQLREAKGFSQQVVADHLGMTQANYHKIESDKTDLRLEYIEKLATFYEVPIGDLLSTEKQILNIYNNTNSNNGIIYVDSEKLELIKKQLETLDQLVKLKDEKITWLEDKLKTFTK